MAIYYKGDVINVADINVIEKVLHLGRVITIDNCNSRKLTETSKLYLKKRIEDLFSSINYEEWIDIEEDKVCDILDEYFYDYLNEISVGYSNDQYEIIGEKIVDENEEIYIKEYYSGLIFPVASFNAQTRDYSIEKYYRNEKNIQLKIGYDFENLAKTQVVVTNLEVADINEVNKYIHQFDIKKNLFNRKGIDKERKNYFINKMTELYNKNVFTKEIVLPMKEEKKELVLQSKETKIMENIEFLLEKLESCNKEKYLELKNKYEDMIKDSTKVLNINSLSLQSLIFLETEIEFCLIYGTDSIKEFLNKRKDEYLNNFINNSGDKTRITIDDLDKISSLFLSKKREYSLIDQREVIRNISLIYLFEMIENKDELDINELENSYVKEFIKSIYIELKVLIKEGLITCDYLFDLESDINLENIINIINSIEINQKEMKK